MRDRLFAFAGWASDGMLPSVNHPRPHSAHPLSAKSQRLLSRHLALEKDWLRQQNRVLRSQLGPRVPLSDADRGGLAKHDLRIKEGLGEVISIVKPERLLAWNRGRQRKQWTFDDESEKPGRPRQGEDSAALILRLAQGNTAWGNQRLCGQLKRPGHKTCPSYVRDVLWGLGLPPAPSRQGLWWKQWLQSHLDLTWATDFFTQEVWTVSGLVRFYVLFVLHLGSRRVWIAECTPQPQGARMGQQAREILQPLVPLSARLEHGITEGRRLPRGP